jgi:murein DD-endopeptidase MepM/ murein hydrolase activator NlpD
MIKLILITFLFLTNTYGNKKVFIKTKKINNKLVAYLHNNSHHHVTLNYNARIKGLTALCPLPTIKSFKPKSKSKVCEFIIRKSNFEYKRRYRWILGTQHASHDDNYLYRLPYEINTKEQVTQGFNGLFSHKGNSLYAIDFGMKDGTKIYASREGLVVKTKYNSKLGGNDKKFLDKANQIIIKHSDDTYAVYNHLKFNSVFVREGQYIKRGQLLGLSGATGYNNGPHLHLIIYKTIDTRNRASIPIKFKTKRGILLNPTRGMYYTAVK